MSDEYTMLSLLSNPQVSEKITGYNLYRIMYSDLSHIGEALLSGKEIGMKRNVKTRDGWRFDGSPDNYVIGYKD